MRHVDCSSPFKGEVGRGMGLACIYVTKPHPHPGAEGDKLVAAPLEGEGTLSHA